MSDMSLYGHEQSKKIVRFLAENPNEAQAFLDSTHQNTGASMFLHNKKMVNYGDKTYIVGKEPSHITKESVPTEFEDKGSLSPHLSPMQFAHHFLRLKDHATTKSGKVAKKALIGSWIDTRSEKNTKKGVQIDLSVGHKDRSVAEKKMINRNEDAIVDASKGFENIYNEEVRHKYTDKPRPPKVN